MNVADFEESSLFSLCEFKTTCVPRGVIFLIFYFPYYEKSFHDFYFPNSSNGRLLFSTLIELSVFYIF